MARAGVPWTASCQPTTARSRTRVAQVRHLVEKVGERRVAAVYSSRMRPAVESAELAASELGLAAVVVDGLQELSAGGLAAVSLKDRRAPHVLDALLRAGPDIGRPAAQDAHLVVKGFAQAVGEIADMHRGETVLVFTHGAAMSLAVRTLLANVGDDLGGQRFPASCALAEVEVDADGWRLTAWPAVADQMMLAGEAPAASP
jgi:broad specificity phosphatase PhoE